MIRSTLGKMRLRLFLGTEFTTNLNIFQFHNVTDINVNDKAHLNISKKSKMIFPSSLFLKKQGQKKELVIQ